MGGVLLFRKIVSCLHMHGLTVFAFPSHLSSYLQELEKLGLGDDVDLHVYEIPVEYQTVQRLIPALWKKHNPQVSENKIMQTGSGSRN